jgi:hypothetical protein
MSILTEVLLLCDGGAECPLDQPFNQDGAKDAKTVSASCLRRTASSKGWTRIGHKDYCLACAARLGRT